jgi:hypothetical protein
MGIVDKLIKKEVAEDPNKLNAQEIQFALQLLKQVMIKGEQVEAFYSLVVKLQNQFLEQTK